MRLSVVIDQAYQISKASQSERTEIMVRDNIKARGVLFS